MLNRMNEPKNIREFVSNNVIDYLDKNDLDKQHLRSLVQCLTTRAKLRLKSCQHLSDKISCDAFVITSSYNNSIIYAFNTNKVYKSEDNHGYYCKKHFKKRKINK